MLFACTRPLLVVRPRRHAWRALPLLTAALVTTPAHMSAAAALSTLSRARGALLGALVGDALALGGHYEYDARVIADKVGRRVQASDAAKVEQQRGRTPALFVWLPL